MQLDYSDIYDIAAFFIGSPEGRVPGRDDLAKQIAEQGRAFAMDHWRWEDMQAYVSVYLILRFIMSSSHAHPHTHVHTQMYRLLLEYSRLMATDRDEWSFGREIIQADIKAKAAQAELDEIERARATSSRLFKRFW